MMQRAGMFMLVLGLTLFGSPFAFAQDDGQAPCPMSGQSYAQGSQSDDSGGEEYEEGGEDEGRSET
jgi:hypothetical protein